MKFPDSSGIYQILNLVNGKIYVGSSNNLYNRRKSHLSRLRNNQHDNKHLQFAWNKYGESNFKFEILQIIKNCKSLVGCEQFWINSTCCTDRKYGYNIAPNAGHPTLGTTLSKSHKLKISEGTKRALADPEKRKKISLANSGSNNYMYGKTHTQEARKKISMTHKGKKLTPEAKERLRLSCTGENNRHAKLNELQVKIIRSLTNELNTKYLTLKDLAEYFNVSISVIGKVKIGMSWRHI